MILGLTVAHVGGAAGPPPSKSDADSLREKIRTIQQNGLSKGEAPRRTPVRQSEVNSYLAFHAKAEIPRGVSEPRVLILGDGLLEGRALVDFDYIRRERSGTTWFDLLEYLSGTVPVTVNGALRTRRGVGQFDIRWAEVWGVPLPKAVLQEIVSFYSRTPGNPQGVRIEDSFRLPAKIREIELKKGEAVIIQ